MARPVVKTRPITVTAPFERVQPVPSPIPSTLAPSPDTTPYTATVNAQQEQVDPIQSAIANALIGLATRQFNQPAAAPPASQPFQFPPAPEQQPLPPSAFTGATLPELRHPFTAPQTPPVQGQPPTLPEPPDVPAMPPSAGGSLQRLAGKMPAPENPALPPPPAAPAPRPKKSADPFQTVGDPNSRIAFVIPHGDELTAQEVLNEHLKAGNSGYGLVSNTKTRNIGKVPNPNAVFGDDNPLRARYEADLFGPNRDIVIGLHNTRGGALKLEQNRSDQMSLADKGYGGYILTTSPEMYEGLKKSPYNVVLQSATTPANDDHSMSRYAATTGKPYVNVEAVRGDKQKQREMLNWVMKAHQQLQAAKKHSQAAVVNR